MATRGVASDPAVGSVTDLPFQHRWTWHLTSRVRGRSDGEARTRIWARAFGPVSAATFSVDDEGCAAIGRSTIRVVIVRDRGEPSVSPLGRVASEPERQRLVIVQNG